MKGCDMEMTVVATVLYWTLRVFFILVIMLAFVSIGTFSERARRAKVSKDREKKEKADNFTGKASIIGFAFVLIMLFYDLIWDKVFGL